MFQQLSRLDISLLSVLKKFTDVMESKFELRPLFFAGLAMCIMTYCWHEFFLQGMPALPLGHTPEFASMMRLAFFVLGPAGIFAWGFTSVILLSIGIGAPRRLQHFIHKSISREDCCLQKFRKAALLLLLFSVSCLVFDESPSDIFGTPAIILLFFVLAVYLISCSPRSRV